jgi:uncharacterized membrane protein YbhN (UPF0104 family)
VAELARYLVPVFKLFVVPVGLLVLAAELVNDPRLGLVSMDPWAIAAALAINQVALTLFAVRMQTALAVFGVPLALAHALRVHLQSMFYFFVLPMTVGLEVSRFTKIRNLPGERVDAAALTYALLADRVVGALAASVLAVALLPFVEFVGLVRWGGAASWLWWGAAGIGGAALLLLHGRIRAHLKGVMELCLSGRRGLWAALIVAMVTHCCFAFAVHLAARGANVEITYLQTLFTVSAAMIFVVIPISFAGVSPVEAAGLGVLVGLGIPVEQAAIVVLMSYLAKLLAAFEGGAWEVYEGGAHLSRLLGGKDRPGA